jgi:hypothetical protein
MDVGPPLEQHLRELEERLFHADVRGARDDLAILLDDRFVEFSKSGRIYDKDGVVNALESEALQPSPRTFDPITDFKARLLGPGFVLVTYHVSEHAGHAPIDSLRSSIWTSSEGRWRLLFHQGTPIPK